MTPYRIQVISPRTWGEFGNYLAASRFTNVLRDHIDARVTLYEAESMLPWVGEVGGRIRTITLTSPDTATRTERYLALMAELAVRWPAGFEAGTLPTASADQLAGLVAHFRATTPDLVVGTKGFITRLCLAAIRLADRPGWTRPLVVNQVTNPGLLDLAIHRSPYPDLTLIGFEWARTRLIDEIGAPPDRVVAVGPLVAQHDLKGFLTSPESSNAPTAGGWDGGDRPKVIIFCNRGGDDYLRFVEHLADRDADIDLVFVGYADAEFTERAAALARTGNTTRWRFHSKLSQADYFEYIAQAAKAPHAFLVSKAGPATTLEAAFFGIPVLMLHSGLPMERWVSGLIHDEGLGRCCESADELIACLDSWLDDPARIAEHKALATAYAATSLDQAAVGARIGRAVRALRERG